MPISNYESVFKEPFSRKYGGTSKGVADPYLRGYNFTCWQTLPTILKDNINSIVGINEDQCKNLLSGASIGWTVPSSTLQRTAFNNLIGTHWNVATNTDYGDSFSITYNEFQDAPISRIHSYWLRIMDNVLTGNESKISTYEKKYYVATVYLIQTKANVKKQPIEIDALIEKAFAMTGVFPTTDNNDVFGGDIANISKTELNIQYNIDYIWSSDNYSWVMDEAKTELQKILDTMWINKKPEV